VRFDVGASCDRYMARFFHQRAQTSVPIRKRYTTRPHLEFGYITIASRIRVASDAEVYSNMNNSRE
jgi:hypothetical protein